MTTTEPAEMKPCREAFERWWSPLYDRSLERNGDGYSLMQTQLAWDAWKNSWNTRTPPAAPAEDGFAVVPIEPNGPQIMAGIHCLERNEDLPNIGYGPKAVQIYKAMVQNAASNRTLRRETMTEAELEWEACYLHNRAQVGNDTVDEIMALAKKFRG